MQSFTAVLVCFGIVMFNIYVHNYLVLFQSQTDFHIADLVRLSTSNLENQIDKIDQLSVTILTDNTVQTVLPQINRNSYDDIYGGRPDASYAVSAAVRPYIFAISGVIEVRIFSLNEYSIKIGTYLVKEPDFPVSEETVLSKNGGAVWSLDSSHRYLCLSRAILSTKTMLPVGWMEIICQTSFFDNVLKTGDTLGHGLLYLLDEDYQILASSENEIKDMDCVSLAALFEGNDAVTGEMKDPASGEKSMFRISGKLSTGWRILSTVPNRELYAMISRQGVQTAFIIGILFGIAVFLIHYFLKRMMAPVGNLRKAMRNFGNGDLNVRVVNSTNDEIAQIGDSFNQMADNIQNLYERIYSLEIANKEAEIEFLKMQINPHFLYNCLDNISWMAYSNRGEDVSDMAVSMARLLRASIQMPDWILVEQEIAIVENYLKIQHYRFGDRIRVVYDIDEEVLKARMPGFILQPVIENSIIHGLEPLEEGGILSISIKISGKRLFFCVGDNGIGIDESQLQQLIRECRDFKGKNSIGLKNVYRRLMLIYGEKAEFKIESSKGKGTTVSIEIPADERWT